MHRFPPKLNGTGAEMMAVPAGESHPRLDGARTVNTRLICLILCLGVLISLPGCGGCSCRRKPKTQAELDREREEEARRLQLEREKLKPPLETDLLVSEPYDPRAKTRNFLYKPGHWTSGMLWAKANHDDILGDLEIAVSGAGDQPMGLVATAYTLSTQRSVALPKKQPKQLQSQVFVPAVPEKARITSQITTKRGGRVFEGPAQVSMRMPAYQYHFVVLARWPERYSYVEKLDSCRMPHGLSLDASAQDLYRVVLIQAEKQTTLPASALFWTSTACLLWDDAEPDALSMDQQAALVDWLHWGGQLVISGPESLDSLKDSFLGPYLPATASGSRELGKANLAELSKYWPIGERGVRQGSLPLVPVRSWSGVHLRLGPQARFVPNTGDLVAQRRVGQGRVVVSAFALNGSELTGWSGFDAFFNGCLLGRKGRSFQASEGQATVCWNDRKTMLDPRRLCQLRYFTRDTCAKFDLPKASPSEGWDQEASEPTELMSDVASWSDSNLVANAARESLKNAARIEIPSRSFVVWVVGVYLLVLVPLNWLVFRALERVEWAWVAAPLIAVGCTTLVVRLAQLDIGFARSSTEIGVVELQDDYPRAHLTRYTALYTSLSTAYQFHFDESGAQILPFPTRLDDLTVRFGRTHLRYRYGKDVELEGLRVLSNSTGLVHSEHLLDLGGSISLLSTKDDGFELVNGTTLTLHGAGVIRRDEQNRVYVAWLDDVEPQSRRPVPFDYCPDPTEHKSPWSVYRDSRPQTAQKQPDGQIQAKAAGALNIRALLDLAEQEMLQGTAPSWNGKTRPGDARLVAWIDEPLPGMQVTPAAPQARHAALVLAHLRHGYPAAPEPDSNTRVALEDTKRVLEHD
jgi:hypothetical protein